MPAGVNEDKWKKAKSIANDSDSAPDKGTDAYWAYVRGIYNKMDKESLYKQADQDTSGRAANLSKMITDVALYTSKWKVGEKAGLKGLQNTIDSLFPKKTVTKIPQAGTQAGKVVSKGFTGKIKGGLEPIKRGLKPIKRGLKPITRQLKLGPGSAKAYGILGAAALGDMVTSAAIKKKMNWSDRDQQMFDYLYNNAGQDGRMVDAGRFNYVADKLVSLLPGINEEDTISGARYKKLENMISYGDVARGKQATDLYNKLLDEGNNPLEVYGLYRDNLRQNRVIPNKDVVERMHKDILDKADEAGVVFPEGSPLASAQAEYNKNNKIVNANPILDYVEENRPQLATLGGAGLGSLLYMLSGGKKLTGYIGSGLLGAGAGYAANEYGDDVVNWLRDKFSK